MKWIIASQRLPEYNKEVYIKINSVNCFGYLIYQEEEDRFIHYETKKHMGGYLTKEFFHTIEWLDESEIESLPANDHCNTPSDTISATNDDCLFTKQSEAFKKTAFWKSRHKKPNWGSNHKIEDTMLLIKAINGLLGSPYGCGMCDSGTLRDPRKEHFDDCPYKIATELLIEYKRMANEKI